MTASVIATAVLLPASVAAQPIPEQRAIQYLAAEVPAWSRDNRCFSCHNDGDGARALSLAVQLGFSVPRNALAATLTWLAIPSQWDHNRGDPAFGDKKLARIQFAASLNAALDAGLVKDTRILAGAAESLLPYQEADGSWTVDTGDSIGSPVTYGSAIATWLAAETLRKADPDRFAPGLNRARNWLAVHKARTTIDAAAQVLALPERLAVRNQALALIRSAQSTAGGWGPYRHAPAEPFDTALALLALQKAPDPADHPLIAQGRAYLIRTQLPPGGWPPTTRPPGAQSYAQHISTTAWAAIALLLTNPERH